MNLTPKSFFRFMESRSNLAKIFDNVAWLFFDKILRVGVGLFVGIWVARYLGPEQFGLLSFAVAFVGMFGAIAGLGLKNIVVRDIVRSASCKGSILGTAAMLQSIGGLIAYGISLISIFWLRPTDPQGKLIVAILGSALLFKASEIVVYWFESQVLSKYVVWVQNSTFLVFAVIKVGLVLNNTPLIAFAWAAMAEALTVALLLIALIALRGLPLNDLRISAVRAKQLLRDSWALMLSSVAVVLYMRIDQIMLGQMLGDEAVGIYSAAVRISEVWYFIPMVITASVFPAILEAKDLSEARYYAQLKHLFNLMSIISLPGALLLSLMSPFLVATLFGDSYAAAAGVLAVHVWAAFFVFLGVASSKWFLAEGLQKLLFLRTVINAVINIALNYLLIPEYGPIGAAIALLISQSAGMLVYDRFRADTRRLLAMKISSINLLKSIKSFKGEI
ncbi:MAG: flippase [Congregibacter sp.]